MVGQIVEITDPGHWLRKHRGFLQVHHDGEQLGQVPLDDIAAIIIAVPGCSVSTNLLDSLAQRNVPIVTCGKNYMPTSWTLPVQGHGRQFSVMRAQMNLSEPKRKRAWQAIIRAKINGQAEVLARAGRPNMRLKRLAEKVRSGDPENCEAQAARAYWQTLFGSDFRRDREAPGANTMLNYAYAIARACVARGVVSAGLHPSISLHHKNPQNPMNLVDDMIEPFRPIVDLFLWEKSLITVDTLDRKTKTKLAGLTALAVPMAGEDSPFSLAATHACRSLANYCLGEADEILFPTLPLSLDVASA